MAGNQEVRLRHLIAGAQLDAAIDAELDQWKNAKERLHEVGAALIAVSTPVSENLGPETVKSALESFKAVGQKVNDRADDISAIHQALTHAVTVTRSAQTVVSDLDADQRDKPEFPPSKPGDDEADEMQHLKVYSGQMNAYNGWADARETKAQQHADQVETAWQDAIAVMEKIPDDQTGGTGPGGGGSTGTGPIMPTTGTSPTTPVAPTTTPTVPTPVTWDPHQPHHPTSPTTPTTTTVPTPPTPTPPTTHSPGPASAPPGGGFEPPAHQQPGHVGPAPGLDPYGPGTSAVPDGPGTTGTLAPTAAVTPGSLSGYAVGGVAGAGILGGIQAGVRAAGLTGATSGLRGGGILGATSRAAGSTRGSLGASGARGTGAAAGGAASGRGTGSRGSRGAAGRRGAGRFRWDRRGPGPGQGQEEASATRRRAVRRRPGLGGRRGRELRSD